MNCVLVKWIAFDIQVRFLHLASRIWTTAQGSCPSELCDCPAPVNAEHGLQENDHSPTPNLIEYNSRQRRDGLGLQSKKTQKPTPPGKPRILAISVNRLPHTRVSKISYHDLGLAAIPT
jgi:hypothetical protein